MATVPSDVLMFLAELETFTTALINKYYDASEADKDNLYSAKAFRHYAPVSVRVFADNMELARFYEEGVDIYPSGE